MEAWAAGAAATVAVVTALVLRPLLPVPATVAALAAASAVVGWGVISARPDPPTHEVVLAAAAMAVLGPAHVRALLGPFGRR